MAISKSLPPCQVGANILKTPLFLWTLQIDCPSVMDNILSTRGKATLTHVIDISLQASLLQLCSVTWDGMAYPGVHGHFVVNPITQGRTYSILFCRCVYGKSLICARLIHIPYIVKSSLSLWFFHDDLEWKFGDLKVCRVSHWILL